MVKDDSKRINVRLRTVVRFELEELMKRWGVGMTAALERAIHEAHVGVSDVQEISERLAVGQVSSGELLRDEDVMEPEVDRDMDWGA